MDWASSDHTPARRSTPPVPPLLRTLWVMTRPPNRSVTAGIYETTFGRELRVYCAQQEDNLLDSLLSRTDDIPLERRAGEIRSVLEQQGWTPA